MSFLQGILRWVSTQKYLHNWSNIFLSVIVCGSGNHCPCDGAANLPPAADYWSSYTWTTAVLGAGNCSCWCQFNVVKRSSLFPHNQPTHSSEYKEHSGVRPKFYKSCFAIKTKGLQLFSFLNHGIFVLRKKNKMDALAPALELIFGSKRMPLKC